MEGETDLPCNPTHNISLETVPDENLIHGAIVN